jgi:hypothetical protein
MKSEFFYTFISPKPFVVKLLRYRTLTTLSAMWRCHVPDPACGRVVRGGRARIRT